MSKFPTAKETQDEIDELKAEKKRLLKSLNASVAKKRTAIHAAFAERLSMLAKVLKAAEALEAGTP